jgi:hypothetical protein
MNFLIRRVLKVGVQKLIFGEGGSTTFSHFPSAFPLLHLVSSRTLYQHFLPPYQGLKVQGPEKKSFCCISQRNRGHRGLPSIYSKQAGSNIVRGCDIPPLSRDDRS